MPEFRLPSFARLARKIAQAEAELGRLADHAARRRDAILSDEWEATAASSSGVHNVYNGIEDILTGIARDVDGSVPGGSTAHQDLLDQMVVAIPNVRGPLLSDEVHRELTELKNFRHLVRHRYGIELSGSKVIDNVERVRHAFPLVVAALVDLENSLLGGPAGERSIVKPKSA